MKKNDECILTIEDMSDGGEGIGKVRGIAESDSACAGVTLFVKDAIIGDTVRAKVTKMKAGYGYARLVELISPSPYRIEPPCPEHRRCGGCQLQALSYDKQLEFKEKKVGDTLYRIGGFQDIPMDPIIGMEHPYRYRNKAQYPIGTDAGGHPVAGFFAGRTHSIIPVRDCLLSSRINGQILSIILRHMEKHGIPAYDERSGQGLIRHVLIRGGHTSGQIMVCLIINKRAPYSSVPREILPHCEGLLKKLSSLPGMSSISLNFNPSRGNVILGSHTQTIWGSSYITDSIGGMKYRISPHSFYQVNPAQTERLYNLAIKYADLTGSETVWDLYCGIGTISLLLAAKASYVCGVEINPDAVRDARENARRAGITNVHFLLGKAEEILPQCGDAPDLIFLDPPRAGCNLKLLSAILSVAPARIVYISCHPGTLARDLKILCGEHYTIEKLRPVDMFCHTVHVETVVLMSRVSNEPRKT